MLPQFLDIIVGIPIEVRNKIYTLAYTGKCFSLFCVLDETSHVYLTRIAPVNSPDSIEKEECLIEQGA